MNYTAHTRSRLNEEFMLRHPSWDYTEFRFGPVKRLCVASLPEGVQRSDSIYELQCIASRYWERYRLPLPLLIEVMHNIRRSICYDINFLHPLNPLSVELASRYVSEGKVYFLNEE